MKIRIDIQTEDVNADDSLLVTAIEAVVVNLEWEHIEAALAKHFCCDHLGYRAVYTYFRHDHAGKKVNAAMYTLVAAGEYSDGSIAQCMARIID